MFEIKTIIEFSAAHVLHGYQGKCANLHGHNWKVEVVVHANQLDSIGLSIDFKILKDKTKEIINKLDHINLNDLPYFKDKNPTAENVAQFLYNELKEKLLDYKVKLDRVSIWETTNSSATYFETKPQLRIV